MTNCDEFKFTIQIKKLIFKVKYDSLGDNVLLGSQGVSLR